MTIYTIPTDHYNTAICSKIILHYYTWLGLGYVVSQARLTSLKEKSLVNCVPQELPEWCNQNSINVADS